MLKNEADEAWGRFPPNRGEQRGKYTAFAKVEKRARTIYRRTLDEAFGPVVETVKIIQQAEAPAAIGGRLKVLPVVPFTGARKSSRGSQGGRKIVQWHSRYQPCQKSFFFARPDLTRRDPRLECTAKSVEQVLTRYGLELTWPQQAAKDPLPGLVTFEAAIWEPIGLRSQARLNSDQPTEVASCLLVHRDVSLKL